MKHHVIRRYLFAGLLVWIPVWTTFFVLNFLIDIFDGILNLLPAQYQPQQLFGFSIPGLGLIISLAVVLLTGLFVTNFLGRLIVNFSESLLDRIPLVRTIYRAVKQVVETIFSSSNDSFRRVLLVEYPRKGSWSIAFQTSTASEKISQPTNQRLLAVFVPTTPNPTSGFLIMVPEEDAIELDLSVDEALKMVISLGVMQPGKTTSQTTESLA